MGRERWFSAARLEQQSAQDQGAGSGRSALRSAEPAPASDDAGPADELHAPARAVRASQDDRRLRILYSHRILSKDGQGLHIDAIVAALRTEGHEVLVVGPDAYEDVALGGDNRLVTLLRRWMPAAVMELAELAYSAPAYRKLARAAAAFRPDVIYERYNLFYIAGALLARRHRLPFLVEVNAPLADERTRFGNLALHRLARWSEAFVWRSATKVLPVTEVLAGHVEAAGVPPERIVVISNGIDPEEILQARAGPTDTQEKPELVLGFVGFVRPWHGVDAVVRAIADWRGQPRLSLVVVGEGSARRELEKLAADLGVSEQVRFTGLADRRNVFHHIGTFDIALQPAAVPYACPLKVLEYMATGRAIVAPDQPNLRELLDDGRTALLFDPAREPPGEAMRDAVQRLVRDPALRAKLGAAAKAEISRRDLTWIGNARRIVGLAKAEIARRELAP